MRSKPAPLCAYQDEVLGCEHESSEHELHDIQRTREANASSVLNVSPISDICSDEHTGHFVGACSVEKKILENSLPHSTQTYFKIGMTNSLILSLYDLGLQHHNALRNLRSACARALPVRVLL